MDKLTNWRAKRAGGRITVYGTDDSNKQTKRPGVEEITVVNGEVIATDASGARYHLVVN